MNPTIRVRPIGATTWFVEQQIDGDWHQFGTVNYPGNIRTVPYHAVSEFDPELNGGRGGCLHNACFPSLDEAVGFLVRQCVAEPPVGMKLNAVRMLDGKPVNCFIEEKGATP